MANGQLGSVSKHYFTLKEAAAYIGVNRKTFYRWVHGPRKDRPPIVNISANCKRVPIERFMTWIANRTEN